MQFSVGDDDVFLRLLINVVIPTYVRREFTPSLVFNIGHIKTINNNKTNSSSRSSCVGVV